jgi:hypothetical protein
VRSRDEHPFPFINPPLSHVWTSSAPVHNLPTMFISSSLLVAAAAAAVVSDVAATPLVSRAALPILLGNDDGCMSVSSMHDSLLDLKLLRRGGGKHPCALPGAQQGGLQRTLSAIPDTLPCVLIYFADPALRPCLRQVGHWLIDHDSHEAHLGRGVQLDPFRLAR